MAPDVAARSASHFLTRDDQGWALWAVDQDPDEPLLIFRPDEAGEQRARAAFEMRSRETRRVRIFAIAAVVAAIVWLTMEAGSFLITEVIARDEYRRGFFDGEIPAVVVVGIWMGAVEALASTTFEIAVGLFIVAWLQRRWRREG